MVVNHGRSWSLLHPWSSMVAMVVHHGRSWSLLHPWSSMVAMVVHHGRPSAVSLCPYNWAVFFPWSRPWSPRSFMVVHGHHGRSWSSMVTMVVHGRPWFPWSSMVFHGRFCDPKFSLSSMVVDGRLWSTWSFMVVHGLHGHPMVVHGHLGRSWSSMVTMVTMVVQWLFLCACIHGHHGRSWVHDRSCCAIFLALPSGFECCSVMGGLAGYIEAIRTPKCRSWGGLQKLVFQRRRP